MSILYHENEIPLNYNHISYEYIIQYNVDDKTKLKIKKNKLKEKQKRKNQHKNYTKSLDRDRFNKYIENDVYKSEYVDKQCNTEYAQNQRAFEEWRLMRALMLADIIFWRNLEKQYGQSDYFW